MEIYRSTYRLETPLETLLNRAENIPSFMKIHPPPNKIAWSPGLPYSEHHQMNRIQHQYVNVPRLLCTLRLQVISRLSTAETDPKSNFLSPDIKDRLSRGAHFIN